MIRRWIEESIAQPFSLLVLRVFLAVSFIYHGYPKSVNWERTIDKFVEMGFPGILGPVVGVVEVVAGILLLLGIFSRFAALALGIIITVAIVAVQIPVAVGEGVFLTAYLERDLLMFAGLLVIISWGPGLISYKKK